MSAAIIDFAELAVTCTCVYPACFLKFKLRAVAAQQSWRHAPAHHTRGLGLDMTTVHVNNFGNGSALLPYKVA